MTITPNESGPVVFKDEKRELLLPPTTKELTFKKPTTLHPHTVRMDIGLGIIEALYKMGWL